MDRRPGERSRGGAGHRFSSGLALLACLLCVGLAVGGLVLAPLNGRTTGEVLVEENTLAIAVLTVAFSVVGALIAAHRPGNSIGWIFCAVGLFQGLANFGYEYATYALITRPGSLPLGAFMSWIGNWTWAPGLGLVLVFLPLLFPDGRPPSRRWWLAGWVGGASIAAITALHAGYSRVVRTAQAARSGLYRPPLLQEEVRRGQDARGLYGKAARRDEPGHLGRRPRGGGEGDGAAGPRLTVAAASGQGGMDWWDAKKSRTMSFVTPLVTAGRRPGSRMSGKEAT